MLAQGSDFLDQDFLAHDLLAQDFWVEISFDFVIVGLVDQGPSVAHKRKKHDSVFERPIEY